MKLLHLDSSSGTYSASRTLSAAIVERFRSADPTLDITYRDLADQPIPHLSGRYLPAVSGRAPRPVAGHDPALDTKLLDEFLASDIVVIGVGGGYYNLTVPSQLKAWIDRIMVAGKTFRYGDKGQPVGLAGGKRVVLAVSRGGFFRDDPAMASFEHAGTYLNAVFRFIGVEGIHVIDADDIAAGPEMREQPMKEALGRIAVLPAFA